MNGLVLVRAQTFTNSKVELDGKRFEKCRFINCHIVYSGGPAEFDSCEFSPLMQWEFRGAAGTLIQVLQQCGWSFQYGSGPQAEVYKISPERPQ